MCTNVLSVEPGIDGAASFMGVGGRSGWTWWPTFSNPNRCTKVIAALTSHAVGSSANDVVPGFEERGELSIIGRWLETQDDLKGSFDVGKPWDAELLVLCGCQAFAK